MFAGDLTMRWENCVWVKTVEVGWLSTQREHVTPFARLIPVREQFADQCADPDEELS